MENKNHRNKQGPKTIALFAGAGGLDTGFKLAGFNIVIASDYDEESKKTYTYNNPDTKFIKMDIRELHAEELLNPVGIKPSGVDLLIGGPPCQGFSLANQSNRTQDNPNNQLTRDFIRLTAEIRPRWFVMENVIGLIKMKKGEVQDKIIKAFKKYGYNVTACVLKASDYGVPQERERVFFIRNRMGKTFIISPKTLISTRNCFITVKQAILDLPNLYGGAGRDLMEYDDSKTPEPGTYAYIMRNGAKKLLNHRATQNGSVVLERYKYIKQGENWSSIPKQLMGRQEKTTQEKRKKVYHSNLYRRLKENEPSITIVNFRKSMIIHPWEDRGLTVREAARLQSFFDTYRFLGSLGAQQQQVANAVPPLLAKAVAVQIMKELL